MDELSEVISNLITNHLFLNGVDNDDRKGIYRPHRYRYDNRYIVDNYIMLRYSAKCSPKSENELDELKFGTEI